MHLGEIDSNLAKEPYHIIHHLQVNIDVHRSNKSRLVLSVREGTTYIAKNIVYTGCSRIVLTLVCLHFRSSALNIVFWR
jgi:hypothetical protein